MSAFFSWDTEPVKEALLAALARKGVSLDWSDYPPDTDEWTEACVIDLPSMEGAEHYTDTWDINIWTDDNGLFTISAYPLYEMEGDYSSWITLVRQFRKDQDEN